MEPRAEMTIANVIQKAAPWPTTVSTTSEAMCGELATLSKGRTFMQAALKIM